MALTKTDIYTEIDKIVKQIDSWNPGDTDAVWTARVARGITRLKNLSQQIRQEVHE